MTIYLKSVPVRRELFVMDLFKNKKKGTFVEVGTCADMAISGTLLLEKLLNWKGMVIDYDTEKLLNVEIYRKCVIVQEQVSSKNIPHFGRGLISPTCGSSTLSQILADYKFPKHIDYLNINATYNMEILQGIDWKKHSFGCISFPIHKKFLLTMSSEYVLAYKDDFEQQFIHSSLIEK